MIVGIGKIELYLPACHSLKEKRRVLRKLKDRAFNEFKIQISEVGKQDFWQSAEMGFSFVGNDHSFIQSLIDKVFYFINSSGDFEVQNQSSEIIHC